MPAPKLHIPGKHISNAGFMNDMANLLKPKNGSWITFSGATS